VLACRDLEKAAKARTEILARTPAARVDLVPLELGSLRSVRACAGKLRAEYPRIDVLINNAGVFPPDYRPTEDGFEKQIGVNHLGHFPLTNLLAERSSRARPRVVTVSSMMHAGGRSTSRAAPGNSAMAAYRHSSRTSCSERAGRRLADRGVTSTSSTPA
jgi:NAD(P)-dependent dehydrogenase (short-subunit alcohol dehydrogenase family)